MTADERIERLLNRFGETIEDLPEPTEALYAYKFPSRFKAMETATDWCQYDGFNAIADYVCHLTDVIDRMENALMTAHRLLSKGTISCEHCNHEDSDCFKHCQEVGFAYCFDIDDKCLTGGIEVEEDGDRNEHI